MAATKNLTANEIKQLEAQLHRFVLDSQDLRALEKQLKQFNVFDVLKSTTHELRHSNILAWLMDPCANHGLGELFLRRWLMEVCAVAGMNDLHIDLNPVEVDTTPFKSVKVCREWNNIDILVDIQLAGDDHWIIVIENKVRSVQGTDQLRGYRAKVEATYPTVAKRLYFFLTMYNEQPLDRNFIPTTYEVVHQALGVCLDEARDVMPAGPVTLIDQYRSILQEQFMEKTPTVELAHRIYWAHREALDYLFEHMPDVLDEATKLLWNKLEQLGPAHGLVPVAYKKGEVSFIPKAWDVPANKDATWPKVWCYMRFNDLDDMTMRAMIGNKVTDEAWRDAIRVSAVAGNYNPSSKHTTPLQWFTFYIEKLGAFAHEESDAKTMADMLWTVLLGSVSKAPFTTMSADLAQRIQALPVTAVI